MAVKKTLADMEQFIPDSAARKRLASLFDADSFVELNKFVSSKGETTSVITGYGLINGAIVYAFAQDVSIKSGAMTKCAASKIKNIYGLAAKTGSPVVAIYDSKGGDISEGVGLIAAYSDILAASTEVSGVVPQIALITGVCPGIASTLACLADLVVMTEESELFLTAPFVAKDTKFVGAGTSLNAAKSGVAAVVEKTEADAVKKVRKIISMLPQNNLDIAGNDEFETNEKQISDSLKGIDMITAIADKNSVCELYSAFGQSSVTAFASLNWRTVGFLATNKTDDKLSPSDIAKMAKFVSLCDSFSIPVISIIDTEGFEPSNAAELSGSVRDTAKLIQVYNSATTTKIALITGKAYGSAFTSISGNDFALAFETAEISPVPPKAAIIFLHGSEINDKAKLEELTAEYAANEASPFTAANEGIIDRIITPEQTREALETAIDILSGKRVNAPNRKHVNYVF